MFSQSKVYPLLMRCLFDILATTPKISLHVHVPRIVHECDAVAIHKLPAVSRTFAQTLPLPVLKVVSSFVGAAFRASLQQLHVPKWATMEPIAHATGWLTLREEHLLLPSLAVGRVAALKLGAGARKLVLIRDLHLRPDPTKVATSIEADRKHSSGCWWAARAFHRARRLGNSSEYAEVLGSFLSRLWDPTSGLQSGALVERLTIRASGFRGDGTAADDDLVHAVCKRMRCKPTILRVRRKPNLSQLVLQRLRSSKPNRAGEHLIHTSAGRTAISLCKLQARCPTAWLHEVQLQRARWEP